VVRFIRTYPTFPSTPWYQVSVPSFSTTMMYALSPHACYCPAHLILLNRPRDNICCTESKISLNRSVLVRRPGKEAMSLGITPVTYYRNLCNLRKESINRHVQCWFLNTVCDNGALKLRKLHLKRKKKGPPRDSCRATIPTSSSRAAGDMFCTARLHFCNIV
jgi:hypothetical protein